MSRGKWTKASRAKAKARKKLFPAPVLAEPLKSLPAEGEGEAGEARESTKSGQPNRDTQVERDSRGGGKSLGDGGNGKGNRAIPAKSFEYVTLRTNSVFDFNHLGASGWQYVGLNNQGWHVFERQL